MYPRFAKRRKRKYPKLGLLVLQSGVAVSFLLMYTSNQIGSTYGELNTSQDQVSSIELCSVFPGQIEQLLSEFNGHIRIIIGLKASFDSNIAAGDYNTPLAAGELSLEELDQAADVISGRIHSASDAMIALDAQLSFNAGVWQQIMAEIGSATAILQQLGGYMISLEPNCLEIRDAQFFEQFQEELLQSGILSESLTDTLSGIIHYLNTIHDVGGSLPTGNPDRVLLFQEGFSFPSEEPVLSFMTKAYSADSDVSPELQSAYTQLNATLTASRDNLASTISTLQEQQIQIAEAKVTLQAKAKAEEEARLALEKAKSEEAERLALEKAKAEAAAEAQKQENEPPKDGVPAAGLPGDEQPAEEPAQEAPAGPTPAPVQPPEETAAPTAIPEANIPEASPVEAPVKETPDNSNDNSIGQPVATPTPVPVPEPNTSKGGE